MCLDGLIFLAECIEIRQDDARNLSDISVNRADCLCKYFFILPEL